MRTIATLTLHLILLIAFQLSPVMTSDVSAEPLVSSTSVASGDTYFCDKCGTYHTRTNGGVTRASSSPPASGQYTSYRPASSATRGGAQNVLSMLNGQRARQGVGSLRYDPQLQVVAERRAQTMASMSLKSHPPGSFSPGRYEGVGWSSSFSPSGVSACYTSESRMQYAGAAMATGRDGVYFAVVYR